MNLREQAQAIIQAEIQALVGLKELIDQSFESAVNVCLQCQGSVVVTGVGKSWLIGEKISATLASTGTPSFGLHPAEALHGDLGRIRRGDVVLALSNSGGSEELLRLLPLLKRDGITIIAVTGRPESDFGQHADIVLNIGKIEEACPLRLAPSASTTAMLAIGDALALCIMEQRGFSKQDYSRFHPAGALGRKLMRVEEIMKPLERTAWIEAGTSIQNALFAITKNKSGAVFILDREKKLSGVFTDGDLRRAIESGQALESLMVNDLMSTPGIRIQEGELIASAAHIMQKKKVDELPVVDQGGVLLGHLDIQDLLDIGIV